ncbi:hypothetical protein PanWU01x14_021440, partial [Parasponia andersonii]
FYPQNLLPTSNQGLSSELPPAHDRTTSRHLSLATIVRPRCEEDELEFTAPREQF